MATKKIIIFVIRVHSGECKKVTEEDRNCICRNYVIDKNALYFTSPVIEERMRAVARGVALVEKVCFNDADAKLAFFQGVCGAYVT